MNSIEKYASFYFRFIKNIRYSWEDKMLSSWSDRLLNPIQIYYLNLLLGLDHINRYI
jgi:hypothetical protein